MKIFNLPDLGEGLPDAEIQHWHVKVGDEVQIDQVLVSVETAKALVEVPAPYTGKIAKLFGDIGDVIATGHPLIGFTEATSQENAATVAGTLKTSHDILEEPVLGLAPNARTAALQATPAVRALARQHQVNLSDIKGSGPQGLITKQDILQQASGIKLSVEKDDVIAPLHGIQRRMTKTLAQAHATVVPVTLCEDAIVAHWSTQEDASVRIIRAISAACIHEPILNSWFDGHQIVQKSKINLGLALDTAEGLYVPVLRDITQYDDTGLRQQIDSFKQQAQNHTIPAEDMQGASFTLSNFGSLMGRYASPMIVPPQVAILGVGRLREQACVVDGGIVAQRVLPLSLTIDHRVITGGQAARFLKALIEAL